jgi:hydroxypyruvate isomerase
MTAQHHVSRRRWLQATSGVFVGATMAGAVGGRSTAAAPTEAAVRNGNIKQSIVQWCFSEYWTPEELIPLARQLGCGSVELLAPKYFPLLKEHGMQCAIASVDLGGDPPFTKGMNNPKYRPLVLKATRDAIDAAAEFGFRRVISFTGMREDIPDDVGADNCVESFKQVIRYAEQKNVTLCLEMLNTRDDSHPMKGHPGYQGDNTEYCIDIIKRVGSPNLKLLFDIYHVQIMDGDVIRRIRQHGEYLGHIHTAGNPGRGELDDAQEINYKAVMQALLDVKYDGFVGQEFIPTRDPLAGLQQAIAVCDV